METKEKINVLQSEIEALKNQLSEANTLLETYKRLYEQYRDMWADEAQLEL